MTNPEYQSRIPQTQFLGGGFHATQIATFNIVGRKAYDEIWINNKSSR